MSSNHHVSQEKYGGEKKLLGQEEKDVKPHGCAQNPIVS